MSSDYFLLLCSSLYNNNIYINRSIYIILVKIVNNINSSYTKLSLHIFK